MRHDKILKMTDGEHATHLKQRKTREAMHVRGILNALSIEERNDPAMRVLGDLRLPIARNTEYKYLWWNTSTKKWVDFRDNPCSPSSAFVVAYPRVIPPTTLADLFPADHRMCWIIAEEGMAAKLVNWVATFEPSSLSYGSGMISLKALAEKGARWTHNPATPWKDAAPFIGETPEPPKKKYMVTITRSEHKSHDFEVEARDEEHAREVAMDESGNFDYSSLSNTVV